MCGSEALQRTQKLPIGIARGGFEDLDAALVVFLGRRVVLEAVVNRAAVREWIDQRAVVLAVLLFGEGHDTIRQGQRVGITLGIEGFAELLVRADTLGICDGRYRARRPGDHQACNTGRRRACLT